MSVHIGAQEGQIAPTVLMPGDPLRAKFIAETYLGNTFCFNQVRGMLGFTGQYGDKRISVMGSGMGMPTLSIYVSELASQYGVKTIIRVGTCGAFQPDLKVGDIVLAMTSSTNSNMNKIRFNGLDFAPPASFPLLLKTYEASVRRGIKVTIGGIFSNDSFYEDDSDWWKKWAEYGVLVTDMETNALYTLAAKYKIDALSILTVSDNIATGEVSSAEQREKEFMLMAELALEISP